MVRLIASLGVACWLGAVGCGSNAPPGTDGGPVLPLDGGPGTDGGGGADGGSSDGGLVTDMFELSLAGPTLNPGEEKTMCVVRAVPGNATVLVRSIESTLNSGSHHLVVYKADGETRQETPFECTPFTELIQQRSVPILISQLRTDRLDLPEGVVYELGPGQLIRIESHYINTALTGTVNIGATVKFTVIPDTPGLQRADFLLFGTPDINVPGGESREVGPRFVHTGIPAGANIFAMTTHTHRWGTMVTAQKSTGRSDPGMDIYNFPEWSWDGPPVKKFDTPLTFADGEGVRFTCDYTNYGTDTARFGESALDEMCIVWLYYYPAAGYNLCFDTDYQNFGEICCPGHIACSFIGAN